MTQSTAHNIIFILNFHLEANIVGSNKVLKWLSVMHCGIITINSIAGVHEEQHPLKRGGILFIFTLSYHMYVTINVLVSLCNSFITFKS